MKLCDLIINKSPNRPVNSKVFSMDISDLFKDAHEGEKKKHPVNLSKIYMCSELQGYLHYTNNFYMFHKSLPIYQEIKINK